MGTCCSTQRKMRRPMEDDDNEYEEDSKIQNGDHRARIRLLGSSRYTAMYSEQGRKGINQDAMAVWEEFTGEKDVLFCGVFDGHGPHGHKIAKFVRDILPSKLSSAMKLSPFIASSQSKGNATDAIGGNEHGQDDNTQNLFSSCFESNLVKCFKEVDEELSLDSTINSTCSGSTAVTVIKQGGYLIISNLGDSRAVLCTRGNNNKLVPIQLTVDLKPNNPGEHERIKNLKGRVFALHREPDVSRLWMPDQNCPGLAMSRAFGDFCLKQYGLISIPEVSYRKLMNHDEFIVLATDGVWDVLTNTEVINIVASARKRSITAKILVTRAVQAWQRKYPTSKVDDCAVICLFLTSEGMLNNSNQVVSHSSISGRVERNCECGNGDNIVVGTEDWSALEGVTRVNSLLKLPQFGNEDEFFNLDSQ